MAGSPRLETFADLDKALLCEGFVVSGIAWSAFSAVVFIHLLRVILQSEINPLEKQDLLMVNAN
jgi:hypothetical protein